MNPPLTKIKLYHPIVETLTNKKIHKYLLSIDPSLNILFNTIDPDSFTGLPKPPYVSLIGAVIGQIIRYSHAKSVRSKLYQTCGNNFDIIDINNLSSKQWLDIGLDINKVEIILRINKHIIKNNITLNIDNIEGIKSLKQIKGIGDWTIDTTILTSFLDWDTFPSGDLFIRNKIKKLYGLTKTPTVKEAKQLSEKWKPYRSIVTWYLWRWFE